MPKHQPTKTSKQLKEQLDTAYDSFVELIKLVGTDTWAGASSMNQLNRVYTKISDCLHLDE